MSDFLAFTRTRVKGAVQEGALNGLLSPCLYVHPKGDASEARMLLVI